MKEIGERELEKFREVGRMRDRENERNEGRQWE